MKIKKIKNINSRYTILFSVRISQCYFNVKKQQQQQQQQQNYSKKKNEGRKTEFQYNNIIYLYFNTTARVTNKNTTLLF